MKKREIYLSNFFVVAIFLFALTAMARAQEIVAQPSDNAVNTPTATSTVSGDESTETLVNNIVEAPPPEVLIDEAVTYDGFGTKPANILPDSPFHFFKRVGWGIQEAFTFNPIKDAQLKLQHANQQLSETKQLVEREGMDRVNPVVIKTAIDIFETKLGDVRKTTSALKNVKEAQPAEINQLLDDITDKQLKQQKVLDGISKAAIDLKQKANREAFSVDNRIEEVIAGVQDTKDAAIESFTNILVEVEPGSIGTRVINVMDRQKGSEFRGLKNLAILEAMHEKVPDTAKEAIDLAKKNTVEKFEKRIRALPESVRAEKFEKYIKHSTADEMRLLKLLDDIKHSDIPDDVLDVIEEAKEIAVRNFEQKLAVVQDRAVKENFFKSIDTGNVADLVVVEELKNRMRKDLTDKVVVEEFHSKAMSEFKQKFADVESHAQAELFKELTAEMVNNPSPKTFKLLKALEEDVRVDPVKSAFLDALETDMAREFDGRVQREGNKFLDRVITLDPKDIAVLETVSFNVGVKDKFIQRNTQKMKAHMQDIYEPEDFDRFHERFFDAPKFVIDEIKQKDVEFQDALQFKARKMEEKKSEREREIARMSLDYKEREVGHQFSRLERQKEDEFWQKLNDVKWDNFDARKAMWDEKLNEKYDIVESKFDEQKRIFEERMKLDPFCDDLCRESQLQFMLQDQRHEKERMADDLMRERNRIEKEKSEYYETNPLAGKCFQGDDCDRYCKQHPGEKGCEWVVPDCPGGYWDLGLKKCMIREEEPHDCGQGFYWDFGMQKCVNDPYWKPPTDFQKCKPGNHWNERFGHCEPDIKPDARHCPDNGFNNGGGLDGCNYSKCPDGCLLNKMGCPTGCMPHECNNNGLCDWNESKDYCPQDCGRPAAYCGDYICDRDETQASCPKDCGNVICSKIWDESTCKNSGCVYCRGEQLPLCGGSVSTGQPASLCGNATSCHESGYVCPPAVGRCGDGVCTNGENCGSCSSDCGSCGGTQTCGSLGGSCCDVCAGGSYLGQVTDCPNCCGICQGAVCPDDTWTTNAGACDYSVCPNGCLFNDKGCPFECLPSTWPDCPANKFTLNAPKSDCNYSTCPKGCVYDTRQNSPGCPTGCVDPNYQAMPCGSSTCAQGSYCVDASRSQCCPDNQKACPNGECVFNLNDCQECGDKNCNGAETSFNCPDDCPSVCGNGYCEPFENCPSDCQSSPLGQYGTVCSADGECMTGKCRLFHCSWGNGVGETCSENWNCESEHCTNGFCEAGGPGGIIGCTDTDGSINVMEKGTTSDAIATYTDYCNGDYIVEYWCDGDRAKIASADSKGYDCKSYNGAYVCESGACKFPPGEYCGNGFCGNAEYSTTCPQDCGSSCSDGVCNGTETQQNCPKDCGTPVCTDTDGSINVMEKGTTSDATATYTDYCNGDYIVEYFCSGDVAKVASADPKGYDCKSYNSSYVCSDGKCMVPAAGYCGDGKCDSGETQASCASDCGIAGAYVEGQPCTPPGISGCKDDGDIQLYCYTCSGSALSTHTHCKLGHVEGDTLWQYSQKCSTTNRECAQGSCKAKCGDGICGIYETAANCPGYTDCVTGNCGNGICDTGETDSSCSQDCSYCGGGYCSNGEFCADAATRTCCPAGQYFCNGGCSVTDCVLPQCGEGPIPASGCICQGINKFEGYCCRNNYGSLAWTTVSCSQTCASIGGVCCSGASTDCQGSWSNQWATDCQGYTCCVGTCTGTIYSAPPQTRIAAGTDTLPSNIFKDFALLLYRLITLPARAFGL